MNAKKEITIYDIAKELAVSPSTVSKALSSRRTRVSKKTISKIRQKAEELGYRQNFFASKLRNKRTQMIAAIVPRLNSSGISNIISGAETTARELGYNLVVSQSMGSVDQYIATIRNFNDNFLEGIIVTRTELLEDKTLRNQKSTKIPQIIIEAASSPNHASTPLDKFALTYELTADLLEKGCKRIAFVYANTKINDREPLQGYRKALQDSEIKDTFVWGGFDLHGMQCWETIFLSKSPPDGVIYSDEITTAFSIRSSNTFRHVDELPRTKTSESSIISKNVIVDSIPSHDALILKIGKVATSLLISVIESEFENKSAFE